MTIYYDPQRSLFFTIFSWKNTAVRLAVVRLEFWLFILYQVIISVALNYFELHVGALRWEASWAIQSFLTFMLVFFNGHCYDRYNAFYESCMAMLHTSVKFVHEVTVSLPIDPGFLEVNNIEMDTPVLNSNSKGKGKGHNHKNDEAKKDLARRSRAQQIHAQLEEVEHHRLGAVRYVLATIFLFNMAITGGVADGNEWEEVMRKGLLTRTEARMLQDYPGGRVTCILASWAMQTVQEALKKEVFWQTRSMHPAHIQNRLNKQVVALIKATHSVQYQMAMPIPFPYYHIMNIIMVFNFLILGASLAEFGVFGTFSFALALSVFMGLREVAVASADPFGTDEVDFPIEKFCDYAFDHCIALHEAFSNKQAYARVLRVIELGKGFKDEELLRSPPEKLFYSSDYRPKYDNAFAWDKETPLHAASMAEKTVGVKQILHKSLIRVGLNAAVKKDGDKEKPTPQAGSQHANAEAAPPEAPTAQSATADEASGAGARHRYGKHKARTEDIVLQEMTAEYAARFDDEDDANQDWEKKAEEENVKLHHMRLSVADARERVERLRKLLGLAPARQIGGSHALLDNEVKAHHASGDGDEAGDDPLVPTVVLDNTYFHEGQKAMRVILDRARSHTDIRNAHKHEQSKVSLRDLYSHGLAPAGRNAENTNDHNAAIEVDVEFDDGLAEPPPNMK